MYCVQYCTNFFSRGDGVALILFGVLLHTKIKTLYINDVINNFFFFKFIRKMALLRSIVIRRCMLFTIKEEPTRQ